RRSGAQWIEATATGLDVRSRRLHLRQGAPIVYDTISFDVGSTVSDLDRPGVLEHTLPTRPIGMFAHRVEAGLERLRRRPRCRLVVVGAGAGGVELACAFRARLNRFGLPGASVTLLERGSRILPGYPCSATRRIERHAEAHRIETRCQVSVARAED